MIIQREHYVKDLLSKQWNGKVKIITGIRRCGKSFLLSTLYKDYLKSEGVSDDCFVEIALDNRYLSLVSPAHQVLQPQVTEQRELLSSLHIYRLFVTKGSKKCV